MGGSEDCEEHMCGHRRIESAGFPPLYSGVGFAVDDGLTYWEVMGEGSGR